MLVRSLEIRRFRNIATLSWRPSPGLNLIAGENGQGKTNILEALHFALLGRSFRTSRDEECLPRGAPGARPAADDDGEGATCAAAELENRLGQRHTKIVLGRGWKRVWRDRQLLDRLGALWEGVSVVTFSPDDVDLFRDAPARRRRFMDQTLSLLSRPYMENLARYMKAMKQVNVLMKPQHRGGRSRRAEAEAFYPLLGEFAAALMQTRARELAALRELCGELYHSLGGVGELRLEYAASFKVGEGSDAEREINPAALTARFAAGHDESERLGALSAGPHRDDMRMKLDGHDLARHGSQGQHRLAALTLKLAAARRLGEGLDDPPILLLDDFGSELDATRRASVLASLRGKMQVIITATHPDDLGGADGFDDVRFVRAGQWAGG